MEILVIVIPLTIAVILSGPIALIIVLAQRTRITELEREIYSTSTTRDRAETSKPLPSHLTRSAPVGITPPPVPPVEHEDKTDEIPMVFPTLPDFQTAEPSDKPKAPVPQAKTKVSKVLPIKKAPVAEKSKDAGSLEMRIGGRWILIAGVIAIIFAVGFFLKYVIDNELIGPTGRVIIAAISGFAALITGEVSRRRNYEIVAKAVTALGFAILYLAVFAAFTLYGLIGLWTAMILAALITAGALGYAFVLDEVIVAFIALLGGYLAPVLVTLQYNVPGLLFAYVLVLSSGAMICAYRRKWRTINLLAFTGSYISYILWFTKYYWPDIKIAIFPPELINMAVTSVLVYFIFFLVMPILFEIVNRAKAKKEDVLLILANALIAFFFFWRILHYGHPKVFAVFVIIMSLAYLAMMALVKIRCKSDTDLQAMLLTIGLGLFITAMPFIFDAYVLSVIWAGQAVMLVIVGLRYKSIIPQIVAAAAITLSGFNLLLNLPLHTEHFRLIFNGPFVSWLFVALCVCAFHFVYRKTAGISKELKEIISQVYYLLFCGLLFLAGCAEWYCYCDLNILSTANYYVLKGPAVLAAIILLLLTIRPICPKGPLRETASWIFAAAGAVLIAANLLCLHQDAFTLLFNVDLLVLIPFIATCVFASRYIYRKTDDPSQQLLTETISQLYYILFCGIFFFAGCAEWYSHCDLNILSTADYYVVKGPAVIAAITLLLLIIRPICPKGKIREAASWIAAAAGSVIVVANLLRLHQDTFSMLLNVDILVLVPFMAALILFYCFHRLKLGLSSISNPISAQKVYAAIGILLYLIANAEWYFHCNNNILTDGRIFMLRGQLFLLALPILFFLADRIRPAGQFCNPLAAAFAAMGSLFAVLNFHNFYNESFTIFFNFPMLLTLVFVAVLTVSAWLLYKMPDQKQWNTKFASGFGILIIFLLWILLTEQIAIYWRFKGSTPDGPENWKFLAHMYVSVMWAFYGAALMVIGVWKRISLVRYFALGLFALLLAKVFIVDTSEIESVYRVAGFLATGVTLVAVSYLYQYLKKQNFFDTMLTEKTDG